MSSTQRIDEYTRIETEPMGGKTPPASWPEADPKEPLIAFDDVSFRYGPERPRILHGITFAIHRGERVGVVGRTASGKSTVLNALFRTASLDSGTISFGGLDASTLPLGRLRDQLALVPQDVALFGGDIRSALDPLGTVDDAELIRILTELGLCGDGRPIRSLDAAIDNADALSAGERQLVCLARGIVRMRCSSVLVLDEASSSLDAETDAIVQKALRRLEGATIITIARALSVAVSVADAPQIGSRPSPTSTRSSSWRMAAPSSSTVRPRSSIATTRRSARWLKRRATTTRSSVWRVAAMTEPRECTKLAFAFNLYRSQLGVARDDVQAAQTSA